MEIPAHITKTAEQVINSLLPTKSSNKYWKEYNLFKQWCNENSVNGYNEYVLLAYFEFKARNLKSSTLWSIYSMLKSTLNIKNNINISSYTKLIAFLKRKKDGYVPKKSKVLEIEEIEKFICEAPNEDYLLIKVALIIGVSGACRSQELLNLKLADVKNRDDVIVINIDETKTYKPRTACVTKPLWIDLIKQYIIRRPETDVKRFFLFYSKNKCTKQPVGIHTFGRMPYKVATFLKLENPQQYTGYCFRRSSATVLAGYGADITTLKRHGGWKSTSVAEGYIEESLKAKIAVANQLVGKSETHSSLAAQPSTSAFTGDACTDEKITNASNQNLQVKLNDGSSVNLHISNLQHCTVNVNFH